MLKFAWDYVKSQTTKNWCRHAGFSNVAHTENNFLEDAVETEDVQNIVSMNMP